MCSKLGKARGKSANEVNVEYEEVCTLTAGGRAYGRIFHEWYMFFVSEDYVKVSKDVIGNRTRRKSHDEAWFCILEIRRFQFKFQ